MKKIQLCIVVLLLFVAGTAFASDGGCVAQFFGGEEYGGEYMLFIPSIVIPGSLTPLYAYLQYEPYVNSTAFFLYNSWDSSFGYSELDCGSASATFGPDIRLEGIKMVLHVPQVNVAGIIIWADFEMEEVSSEPGHSGVNFNLVALDLVE